MPTGYTWMLAERDDVTFEEFVWRCARGMGALIMMRDDPADAPIPERFEPSAYHVTALEEAKAILYDLERINPAEAEAKANASYGAARLAWEEAIAENEKQAARFRSMEATVAGWVPPTKDHHGLKTFMLEQLGHDTAPFLRPAPLRLSGKDWLVAQLENARRDIAYHERERAEEVARTESRNRWLADLRVSVPPAVPKA